MPILRTCPARVAGALLLCVPPAACGQTPRPPAPLSPEDVATRIVVGIRNRDVAPLLAFAADTGVVIGSAVPPTSASALAEQLQQRRAIYCTLMDGSCISGARPGHDDSLRGRVAPHAVKLQPHPLSDFPERTQFDVVDPEHPSTVLFSIFLSRRAGLWKLIQIQYF